MHLVSLLHVHNKIKLNYRYNLSIFRINLLLIVQYIDDFMEVCFVLGVFMGKSSILPLRW